MGNFYDCGCFTFVGVTDLESSGKRPFIPQTCKLKGSILNIYRMHQLGIYDPQ